MCANRLMRELQDHFCLEHLTQKMVAKQKGRRNLKDQRGRTTLDLQKLLCAADFVPRRSEQECLLRTKSN